MRKISGILVSHYSLLAGHEGKTCPVEHKTILLNQTNGTYLGRI